MRLITTTERAAAMIDLKYKPLQHMVEKLHVTLGERYKPGNQELKSSVPQSPVPQSPVSLEPWPDSVRAVPNAVLRGSLFGISQRRTTAKKSELLASVDGIKVWFKGEKFNQTDLDVWEMLLHLARPYPLGDPIKFSAYALLKALGRGTSGKHHEELKEEMKRLVGGVVEITSIKEKKTFCGSLVNDFCRDEVTQCYIVNFNSNMLSLYQGGYSYIDWEQRQVLGNNNLAKWLQGFYSTHAIPFPYKVETIKTLCGSTTERLRDFRLLLRSALTKLVEVGAIVSWEIRTGDLICIMKTPTLSQQKHLRKHKK